MKDKSSLDSLIEATKSREKFSGHGRALGAAGKRESSHARGNSESLRDPGQSIALSPHEGKFETMAIGVEWDNLHKNRKTGFLSRLLGKKPPKGVDLDLGCFYELTDGTRGVIQAFGGKFGAYNEPPFIMLSGDERTGDADGHDECLLVNGAHWSKVKRLLVYIYIYDGAPNWKEINPRVIVDIPGENDLIVELKAHENELCICAVGGLENIRGGIQLTNYTEYFPGHPEMDRAFGFGLQWADGVKD